MKRQKNYILNSKKEAIILLKKAGCSEGVIKHSLAVSKLSLKIAKKIKDNGYPVDLRFIKIASLLHDIGRSKTHGIKHGITGKEILVKFNVPKEYQVICENHLGGGIPKEEARKLGLPDKDFIPKTLEEKIIAHADNLISGDKVVSLKNTIEKLEKELGVNHPAISGVESLACEIATLTSKSESR